MWSECMAELRFGEGKNGRGKEAALSSKGKEQGRENGDNGERKGELLFPFIVSQMEGDWRQVKISKMGRHHIWTERKQQTQPRPGKEGSVDSQSGEG